MMACDWKGTWASYQDRGFGECYARVSGASLMNLDDLFVYVTRQPVLGWTTAYLYSPEAAASSSPVCRERLEDFVRSHRIARMVVNTNERITSFEQHPSTGGTFVIDLRLSEDELFKNMQGRSRTAIRKGRKVGLRAEKVDEEGRLREWYDMYVTTAEERGFSRLGFSFVRGLWDSPWGALFGVYMEDNLLAGAFLLLGRYPIYLLGGMNPAYRKLSPTNFLQWEILRWAKEEGYGCYDLGGARDDPKHGPTRFKASLGGTFHRSYQYMVKGGILRYGALKMAEACSRRLLVRTFGGGGRWG
jgi:hypothetical protein